MEIRNLGDKYYARLDQLDSHGRSIIYQINVLVKQGLCTRKNNSFTGTGKATGGAQGWEHVLPNTCQ